MVSKAWDLQDQNDSTTILPGMTLKAGSTFWHSSAHLMAEAVKDTFPGVKFWLVL